MQREVINQSEWTRGKMSLTVLSEPKLIMGNYMVFVRIDKRAVQAMRAKTILRDWEPKE